jgi:hypothetical protein
MPTPVPPSLGADSFSCPHCGALAHQYWFKIIPSGYKDKKRPTVFRPVDGRAPSFKDGEDERTKKRVLEFYERIKKNAVTYLVNDNSSDSRWEMVNTTLSQCHSCDAFAVWVEDSVVYPETDTAIRVGRQGEKLYLDLCDARWRAVEVTTTGWSVAPAS